MSALPEAARAVLDFWFAGLAGATDAAALAERNRIWFRADDGFDHECRERFRATVEQALEGALDDWAADPRGRLALVIVLDQLTRNVFRGDARAFAGDARALALALGALDEGIDRALTPVERVFLYMPLQHAEDRAVQQRSVEVFGALAADAPHGLAAMLAENLAYAREHRDIVERFGRYPHRNAALGRTPTDAERAYLEAGGKTFGQG